MADARDRLTAGAARVALADRALSRWADVSRGGLWDMVDATDEPAHVRCPAPPRAATVLAAPAPAPEPEPRPAAAPNQPKIPAVESSSVRREPGPPAPGRRIDVARLAAEYDRLVQAHGIRPTGEVLGKAAGCSKATANRWMKARPRRVAPCTGLWE